MILSRRFSACAPCFSRFFSSSAPRLLTLLSWRSRLALSSSAACLSCVAVRSRVSSSPTFFLSASTSFCAVSRPLSPLLLSVCSLASSARSDCSSCLCFTLASLSSSLMLRMPAASARRACAASSSFCFAAAASAAAPACSAAAPMALVSRSLVASRLDRSSSASASAADLV
ncbi:MAG: hypothetical protein J3K34DRAFT_398878 [Monoraphidium minutum]|nr:MAG: hypothetical protein J3K34DRAFT_398878 [Monoraphidium minutum]